MTADSASVASPSVPSVDHGMRAHPVRAASAASSIVATVVVCASR